VGVSVFQVSVKYKGQERSKVITDHVEQAVVKGFLNNSSQSAVVKNLSKCDEYKKAMVSAVGQLVKQEVTAICKKREVLLKSTATSTEEMINFDFKQVAKDLNIKLPALMGVVSVVAERSGSYIAVVTAVGVLLYSRNQTLNLLQLVLGIVLDNCGLTKEVCRNYVKKYSSKTNAH
jgi:hypothetical protein